MLSEKTAGDSATTIGQPSVDNFEFNGKIGVPEKDALKLELLDALEHCFYTYSSMCPALNFAMTVPNELKHRHKIKCRPDSAYNRLIASFGDSLKIGCMA